MRKRRMRRTALMSWTDALKKQHRATHTHQQALLKSCVQRWHQHVQSRVCERALCVGLQVMGEGRSLRWCLHRWRARLRLRLHRRARVWHKVRAIAAQWQERAVEGRAQRYRRERIRLMATQCLTAWRSYARAVCVERAAIYDKRKRRMMTRVLTQWRRAAQMKQAEHHHHSRLQEGALRHWRRSLIGRLRSRRQALVAVSSWRWRVFRTRQLTERVQEFEWRHGVEAARRCFSRWRTAHRHALVSQDFQDFQHMALCKRVLLGWHHHTVLTQRQQYQAARFQCVHEERVVQRCFVVWRGAVEQAGVRQAELQQRLITQHTQQLRRRLQSWRAATRGRHAHRTHDRRLMQQCLGVWRERRYQRCVSRFQCVHEERVVQRCFVVWRGAVEQAGVRQAELQQRLITQHTQQLRRRLQSWRAATRGRHAHRRHDRRLMQQCFSVLRQNRQQRYVSRFCRRHNRGLLTQYFSVWRESREKLCLAAHVRSEQERKAARGALISWSIWATERRAQRMMREAVCLWLDGRRVSRSFHQWSTAHCHHQVSLHHHRILMLRRTFKAWRSVSEHSKQLCEARHAHACETLVREVFQAWRRTALSQRAVREVFQVWRRTTLSQRAVREVFQAWRRTTLSQKAVREGRTHVREARRRSLLREAFSIWRERFQSGQTRVVVLCKDVVAHWLQFVQRRRTEREAQRRHKLMQQCWSVWRVSVQERVINNRRLQLYWASWKNHTATSLILSTMYNDSLQKKAWLLWRKRRVQSRVAEEFSTNFNKSLLVMAFNKWRSALKTG
ncbi:protein SFI1 homolog [Engraulis encrasicolus]|uniref:protein SFI1 homolog n=1 Tax=Engraulis encrasicolus TaxID=184585 RepID=UPI002FD554B1